MKNQILIILVIFSFSNTTFLRGPNPATEIANSTFIIPKIDKMIASLTKFRNSIPSTSQSKSLLRFNAGDPNEEEAKKAFAPLLAGMESIRENVANMNSEYNDFFDITKLENAEKLIRENIQTARNVNNNSASEILSTVLQSIEIMSQVKRGVKGMIDLITHEIDEVNLIFKMPEELEKIGERPSVETKFTLFKAAVDKLTAALNDAMKTSDGLIVKQEKSSESLYKLCSEFDGLIKEFEDAKNKYSPYQKTTFEIFVKNAPECILICQNLVWDVIFGNHDCVDCLNRTILSVDEEHMKAERELFDVKNKFTSLIVAFTTYKDLSIITKERTDEQHAALTDFNSSIKEMEQQIHGLSGASKEPPLLIIRQMIIDALIPLKEACDALGEKFNLQVID